MPYFDEPGVHFDDPLITFDDPRTLQEILNSQTKPMFDVVLDLTNLTNPQFIQRAKDISAGIAGQAAFASLAAKLTALDTTIALLEDKQTFQSAAQTAAETATAARNQTQESVKAQLIVLGADVGQLATTEAQVDTAELRVKSAPGPKPVPDAPTGLELTVGDEEGELSGQCDGQPGIVEYYEIRYTTGDPNAANPGWQLADTSKKSRFELTGLPTGQKVWVEVRACNARGKSPWSDPASKRVP